MKTLLGLARAVLCYDALVAPSREKAPGTKDIPADYDQLQASEWGLDEGDISQIRDKLAMTPTERLKAAQDFMNAVIRIRAQNAKRTQV